MQDKIPVHPRKIIGKRPNLAAQNTIADGIVSALTPEEPPLPPLSHLPPTKTRAPRKRRPQGAAIAGSILLFLPFLYPVAFFVHGTVTGHPLPFMMFPLLVLIARVLSHLGGLLLYLSARTAGFLRKPIGWTSLSAFVLSILSMALLNRRLTHVNPLAIHQPREWIAMAALLMAMLCMLALCVLSILLLRRVFYKNAPETAK